MIASVVARATGRAVCLAFAAALREFGVPGEVLTDNGKQFTDRFGKGGEVLFDQICRDNGITHRLTPPRTPTTTGKIERFHRSLRAEFGTGRQFATLERAQAALDEWVAFYNSDRPHQSLDMATPASRFLTGGPRPPASTPDRTGPEWVARKVSAVGVVCVSWQQVSVGTHHAGERCDVLVGPDTLQFWIGNELLRTVRRTSSGPVRKKRPEGGALTKTRQAH